VTFDGHIGLEMRGDVLRDVRSEGTEDGSGRIVGDGNLADCQLEPMQNPSLSMDVPLSRPPMY